MRGTITLACGCPLSATCDHAERKNLEQLGREFAKVVTVKQALALADQLAAAVAAFKVVHDTEFGTEPERRPDSYSRASDALFAALAAYQAARGTAYPAPSTESGFHEP